MRVLGTIRLSRDREQSTSPERQREVIERWAADHGHDIVGWAEDLDVSGAVAPWKRPSLGQWLPTTIGADVGKAESHAAYAESRADEWDIVCAWKLDRISRRVVHTWQLHEWCRANGKQVASVDDDYDLTTPIGEFLFGILASFAQMELDTIRARSKSSFDHLMKAGRWRGGFEPYGYRAEKVPDGPGHRLVPDDGGLTDTAGRLRTMVDRIIGGESINALVAALNREGVPTSLDAQRIRDGQEPKGTLWRVGMLSKMLRSPVLLGWATTEADGELKVVRGDDHMPVQRAEPVLTRAVYDNLQAVLDARRAPNRAAANRRDRSALVQVAYCECGRPMYTHKSSRGTEYYRCASKAIGGVECEAGNRSIRRDELEHEVEHALLVTVGDVEVRERVFRPGEDHGAEIADVDRALDDLEGDRQAGLYATGAALERYRRQHAALTARLDELAALPTIPSAWEEVPTGLTYRERWAALATDAERNRELRNAGLVAVVTPVPRGGVRVSEMIPRDGRDYYTHRRGRVEVRLPRRLKQHARTSS